MRSTLSDLLATGRVLLADGATGTNYFASGLESGDPPEFWIVDQPQRVLDLHRSFVDAGADIILTNTFGCNRCRLKLHNAQDRTFDLAKRAAELARDVADAAPRPVVVAGSVGPTGELFEPLGALTDEAATAVFEEQIAGLKAGGADVAWIETMSAVEEVRAAANGAIRAGLPYTTTCSFDTAGRTMMGIMPSQLAAMFEGLAEQPVAMGANCGVGASDILVSLLNMTGADRAENFTGNFTGNFIVKGNCGIPQFRGAEIVYSGTPQLMAAYASLAVHAGARIVGGCCGTSAQHLAAMRRAIDDTEFDPSKRPTIESIVESIGPLTNQAPTANTGNDRTRRRGRGNAA